MAESIEHDVAQHYGAAGNGLLDTILQAASEAGVDIDNLKPADLAPVDEFHTAGRAATLKALEKIRLEPGMHMLDAGSGVGGTARTLAAEHGCSVTGIDLTQSYVHTAQALTRRMKLDHKCRFVHGSVLELPFADETFDGAVSFHAAMNVANRSGFYSELERVLKPGAQVCVFDVMKGKTDGMTYPVPWAETARTSFLKTPEETAELLQAAGLQVLQSEGLRDFALEFFRQAYAKIAASTGPPPLGLHLLTGENTKQKFANYVACVEARQLEPVIMVAAKVMA